MDIPYAYNAAFLDITIAIAQSSFGITIVGIVKSEY